MCRFTVYTRYKPRFFSPSSLWRCGPMRGHGLLNLEDSRSYKKTHHSRQDSSGQVISSSQRPLPHNTQHSQQTSMPPVGFEPTISAGERPQTHALDRAATGTGTLRLEPWLKLRGICFCFDDSSHVDCDFASRGNRIVTFRENVMS